VPESDHNLHLEIGHVLFIDIVGYSKLLNEEQKERLNQLTQIVLATTQVRESTDEQLVRLPTGDGMALVFRHSAEEPARCALEIAEARRPSQSQRVLYHYPRSTSWVRHESLSHDPLNQSAVAATHDRRTSNVDRGQHFEHAGVCICLPMAARSSLAGRSILLPSWNRPNVKTAPLRFVKLAFFLIAASALAAGCGKKDDSVAQAEKKDVAKGIAAPGIAETKANNESFLDLAAQQ
jgi:hypothetical protein